MESRLSAFFRMHWDHEALAFPRRTKSADKSDALQTLRARGQVNEPRASVWSARVFSAAFLRQTAIQWPGGSWRAPFRFFRMHWDHEPRTRNLFICKQGIERFMESLHEFS